jgi:hypothetical protein
VPGAGRGAQRVRAGGLDGGHGRPPHAEVTLDGPGDGGGRDDLAREARLLGVDLDDRVHVGRRAADVDHDDVPHAGPHLVEPAGQQLDAGQHDVRGGAADHRGEVGPLAEVLAADDVGEEDLADRGAGRVGRQHPDLRYDVVGEHVRQAREDRAHLVAGVDVARHDHRAAPPRRHQVTRCPEQHLAVAAVGPPGQQHDVGVGQVREVVAAGEGGHGDDLAPARQRDPAARLGGDQLLVADHRDAQAAAGAGAGQHLGVGRARVLLHQGGEARVVPLEHVRRPSRRGERRRVGRRGHDPAGGQVDQGGLGERRAEVDAQRYFRGGLSQARARGPPPGRRRSRCRR